MYSICLSLVIISEMFTKLITSIIWIGATAIALLVIRQQRIDTVHQIAETHSSISSLEQALWRVRTNVHENINIEHVSEMVARYENKYTVQLIPLYLGDCLRELTLDTISYNLNLSPLPEKDLLDNDNTSLIIDLSTAKKNTPANADNRQESTH